MVSGEPPPAGPDARAPHGRRSRATLTIVAAATVVAALAFGGIELGAHLASSDPAAYARRPSGPLVHGAGLVAIAHGKTPLFCPGAPDAFPDALTGHTSAGACPFGGVHVIGIDPIALSDQGAVRGVSYGYTSLTGHLSGATLFVTAQSAYRPDSPTSPYIRPPCPARSGGWPHGAVNENIDLRAARHYAAEHQGAIVQTGQLDPSRDQVVAYVLTAGDPQPVRSALGSAYGRRLCITRSNYSQRQIHRSYAAFRARLGPGLTSVWGIGRGLSTTAQPEIEVNVYALNGIPRLTQLAASFPKGLVKFYPWLRPD